MFYHFLIDHGEGFFDPQIKNKLVIKDVKREMPQYEVDYEEFAGSNGQRPKDSSFQPFNITLSVDIFFKNIYDKALMQRELANLFFPGTEYYVAWEEYPGMKFCVNPTSLEEDDQEANDFTTWELELTVFRACGESFSSTLSDFSLNEEWQFAQGLVSEDYEYTFTHSRFIVYNAGDFTVDPREHYLKIQVEGESDGEVTIVNKTTKERFIYRPKLSSVTGEWIDITGVYPRKNGINCGIDTNHGLISLVPGVNEIEIQNVSQVKSSWDFNFLYK